ncbi:Rrf2 family transcriptional regulator [Fusobacterium polymorphum]|uniref:RrF2 family transcriptional regulator n=1 Tax=Fusobacterium nucleatum subsp. polymorphum TaxID=76857 RepID=UPI00291D3947|nr:Rrf2 family transcriptional regulator [Fusobacterium nucleatum]BEP11240.1 Rrf2 family transcriptional regulator [Fusobacterium nucleatum]
MKISKSLEQAIFVLLMLALQKDKTTVKSFILSKKLEISDSYLKKILRKMVVADLIVSNASKDGGFQLKKPIEEISLYDVYKAIETTEITDFKSEIARKLFKDEEHIKNREDRIIDTINKAEEDTLKKLKLSELLDSKKYKNSDIDWYKTDEKI